MVDKTKLSNSPGRLTDLASQIFEIFVHYEIAYRNTFELGNRIPGLSPDHIFTCYHNFCIMSPLSRQLSFPLQVKRRDSSFITLMSFSSFPCQPDFFLTVSDPTAELSIIFATVYVLRSDMSRD